MPREFEDEIGKRSRATRKARETKDPAPRSNTRERQRGAKRKGQYTTVGGTPIIERDVT